jgi:hypothetical protein
MFEGHLNKMQVTLDNSVNYILNLGFDSISLNPLLGKKVSLEFKNQINCIHCGKITKKSYAGGHCFPCSQILARSDLCVLRPQLCHYHEGTCREPGWGDSHCMIPHYVYLANTSGLKVGITRVNQLPTRWIDQGAISGLPILKVETRFHSGIVEELISDLINDKTDWRKMLKGERTELDLCTERDILFGKIGSLLDDLEDRFGKGELEFLENGKQLDIFYPVIEYPKKLKSLKLEKDSRISGTLLGIKGQYLLLDCGVINIRNHTGYLVTFGFN